MGLEPFLEYGLVHPLHPHPRTSRALSAELYPQACWSAQPGAPCVARTHFGWEADWGFLGEEGPGL